MPKIRFADLPRALRQHILERVEQRQISLNDLRRLQAWVKGEPHAPDGDSYNTVRRSSNGCAGVAGWAFEAAVRVDTPQEAEYFRHGGILPYVLGPLAGEATTRG